MDREAYEWGPDGAKVWVCPTEKRPLRVDGPRPESCTRNARVCPIYEVDGTCKGNAHNSECWYT